MIYSEILTKHGDGFSNWFHAYSEGLFLQAARWLKPGQVAVDAGCYLGDNALSMAEQGANVLTFEPDPRLRPRMAARLLNEPTAVASRVRLYGDALGDSEGVVVFNIVNELEGHSGLREKFDYGREVSFTRIEVPLRTLDEVLQSDGYDVSKFKLLKFDLEGAELSAFRGARTSIETGRPLILFEFGNLDAFAFTHEEYFEFFASLNYTVIDAFGVEMTCADDLRAGIGWNLFAVPDKTSKGFILGLIAAAS